MDFLPEDIFTFHKPHLIYNGEGCFLELTTAPSSDTDKADEEVQEQLLRLVPTYQSLASSSKVHLIQSLVSRLLVEHIFEAYFIGLPSEQAEKLSEAEKYLGTFGKLIVT